MKSDERLLAAAIYVISFFANKYRYVYPVNFFTGFFERN